MWSIFFTAIFRSEKWPFQEKGFMQEFESFPEGTVLMQPHPLRSLPLSPQSLKI